MADDKTRKGPQDASKVNVQEKYEIDYYGVTPVQLKQAVKNVGTSAKAVQRELENNP